MKRLLSLVIVIFGLTGCENATQPEAGNVSSLPRLDVEPASTSDFVANPYTPDFVVTGSTRLFEASDHFFSSNGDGTFGAPNDIPGIQSVSGADVADMDGDGHNDFLFCETDGLVRLYTNDGSGAFTRSVIVGNLAGCGAIRVGDLNEDGAEDFVMGPSRLGTFVYLQTEPGIFTRVDPALPGASPAVWRGMSVGDVNGDGHQDVVLLLAWPPTAGQGLLYRGDGTGTVTGPTLLFDLAADFGPGHLFAWGLALFDLEGDGDLDIAAGGGSDLGGGDAGAYYVYSNDGAGHFTPPAVKAFDVDDASFADAFDFDRDGDHDLVVVTAPESPPIIPGKLYFVENLGGSLAPAVQVGTTTYHSHAIGAPSESGIERVAVDIDIKPGSDPNCVNPNSRGRIAVAILTTDAFDPADVDASTVNIDGVAPVKWSFNKDVSGDGLADLVFHFRTQDLNDAGLLSDGNTLTLTGALLDETPIEGSDVVHLAGGPNCF